MQTKTLKLVAGLLIGLIILTAGFLLADYFALFGTSTKTRLEFVEVRFRTIDKDSRDLILNAGVRCFQKANNNACTLRDSHQLGVVAVHIPFKHHVKKSLLFTQDEDTEKAADPKIHMMFIHNDYYNKTESLLLEDVFNSPGKEYTVKMQARDWGESSEDET